MSGRKDKKELKGATSRRKGSLLKTIVKSSRDILATWKEFSWAGI